MLLNGLSLFLVCNSNIPIPGTKSYLFLCGLLFSPGCKKGCRAFQLFFLPPMRLTPIEKHPPLRLRWRLSDAHRNKLWIGGGSEDQKYRPSELWPVFSSSRKLISLLRSGGNISRILRLRWRLSDPKNARAHLVKYRPILSTYCIMPWLWPKVGFPYVYIVR